MQTTESLKRRIKSAGDLLSVVKTMKALAAVSIRQYQKAVESLRRLQPDCRDGTANCA